jgi:HSP20 family protein
MIAWSSRPGLPSLGDNGAFCHPESRAFSLREVERTEDGRHRPLPVSHPRCWEKEATPMLELTRRNGHSERQGLDRPVAAPIGEWDPWSEFSQLNGALDRIFTGLSGTVPRPAEGVTTFTPRIDLYETAEELVVNAYLPGIRREDLHLEVLGDTLRIAGETKRNIPATGVRVHVAQGRSGKFDLRYSLPTEINAEQVKATYHSGVLEVRLPKVEAVRPKPVDVHIED